MTGEWAAWFVGSFALAAVVLLDLTVGLDRSAGLFFAGIAVGVLLSLALLLLAERRARSGWTR